MLLSMKAWKCQFRQKFGQKFRHNPRGRPELSTFSAYANPLPPSYETGSHKWKTLTFLDGPLQERFLPIFLSCLKLKIISGFFSKILSEIISELALPKAFALTLTVTETHPVTYGQGQGFTLDY